MKNSDSPVDSEEWKALEILLTKERVFRGRRWCLDNSIVFREEKATQSWGNFRNMKSIYLTCRICKYRIFRLRGGDCGELRFANRK